MSGQGQQLFASLTQLTYLDVGSRILSSASFEALSQLSSLQVLQAYPASITVAGLHSLSPLTSLESCTLWCPLRKVTPQDDAPEVADAGSVAGSRDRVREEEVAVLKEAFADVCSYWRDRREQMGLPPPCTLLCFCGKPEPVQQGQP